MARYPSNRGMGEPLVILGLSGQYIVLGILDVTFLFVLTVVLSGTSLPITAVLLGMGVSFALSLKAIYRMNKRFGRHGLMKQRMARTLPAYLKNDSRVRELIRIVEP